MAPSARTFAMASSLDLLMDAIIALARGAVNTYPRAPADTIQKRKPHDVQENHAPGPPRCGGEIQELGQVGPRRRESCATARSSLSRSISTIPAPRERRATIPRWAPPIRSTPLSAPGPTP